MTTDSSTLRAIANIAALAGYFGGRSGSFLRRLSVGHCRRDFRVIEAEGVRLRVPTDWGELERDAIGRFVVHNRPRRFRIDGDAVWYSTAVELCILPGRHLEGRIAEAMTTTRRLVETSRGPVTLELAVANGLGPSQRAEAEKVLHTAISAS